MSISSIFDIAQTALNASQTGLTVTSNNIANINTPGYSKQDVVLSIANPVGTSRGVIGRGVTVSGIQRSYDQFIQAQLLLQGQNQGRSVALDQTWGQIEQVFNEQQGMGLSQPLADFFNAWNDLATTPESQAARLVLLQNGEALARTASTMERSILDTLSNTNAGITDAVSQVNMIASDIAKINEQITRFESGTSIAANDLRDQRDQKLNELAQLIDFSSYEGDNGSITVTVGMRNLVSGTSTSPLTSVRNGDGNRDLYLDGINITANIQKGQIGGLLASRRDIEATTLTSLRKLMASLTQEVNRLHTQGFGLDGSTGNNFFNPLQITTANNSAGAAISATVTSEAALTLDEYTINFSGGNYNVSNKQTGALVTSGAYVPAGTTIALSGMSVTISGAVTSVDSFTVSPLTSAIADFGTALNDTQQIAAAATVAGIPGDNGIAIQIAQLTDASIANLNNTTFSGYYSGLVSTVGSASRLTNDGLTFDNNLMAALQTQRDSISGVSLDEEAANLIRYQRSYEAAARMIQVADELLQTILSL
jgi:flagellar hook-associated protein 1 FlgK